MSEEIQEIRSLISSDNKFKKSLGYSSLLQFQQHSCVNASSLQSLAHSAQSIISSIVFDIFDDHDEEIEAVTDDVVSILGSFDHRLSALETGMQTITDDAVSILGSFDHRLSALETGMQGLCDFNCGRILFGIVSVHK
ncbi:hypothetical protein VNO80_11612 [Phaseolus coccineus]|uniref:Uncharacterized protein n=1 Tax=Phaseolus coccineus TaxID=3886 RepID=A0AAN9NAW3_PHACN